MIARALYRVALWLAFPLIWLYLLKRSRKQPEYRNHWAQRLGYYAKDIVNQCVQGNTPVIWLHAVSVGEMRAAAPVVKALHAKYPQASILLSCMTPTGRATAAELFGAQTSINATIVFLPYDYPGAIRRFLRAFKPQLGIIIDTEIWPNCIWQCDALHVPLVLANARLSQKSLNGYLKFASLFRAAMPKLTAVYAQTQQDADRLLQMGAVNPQVMGNIKFDNEIDPALVARGQGWRQALARPTLLLASSRDGEEELVIAQLQQLGLLGGETLLIIVPRHPQRFDSVANLLKSKGLTFVRRSDWQGEAVTTSVLLGDSMGEMAAWFSAADVTIMGGSLLKFGSQNMIEAAACASPVLIGPSTFNFAQASVEAVAAGAAWQGDNVAAVCSEAARLLADAPRRAQMSQAGVAFSQAHRGATARLLAALPALNQA